jgi:hypothetical protein
MEALYQLSIVSPEYPEAGMPSFIIDTQPTQNQQEAFQ